MIMFGSPVLLAAWVVIVHLIVFGVDALFCQLTNEIEELLCRVTLSPLGMEWSSADLLYIVSVHDL